MKRKYNRIIYSLTVSTLSVGLAYFGCTKDNEVEEDVQVTPSEEAVNYSEDNVEQSAEPSQEGESQAEADTSEGTDGSDKPIGALENSEEAAPETTAAQEDAPEEANSSFAQVIDDVNNKPEGGVAETPVQTQAKEETEVAPEEEDQGTDIAAMNAPAPNAEMPSMAASTTPRLPETDNAAGTKTYVVKPGDTLSKIAQEIYGDLTKWRSLASMNGLSDPNVLFPGDKIKYEDNTRTAQFSTEYNSLKRDQIEVRKGDSLYSISARVFGTGNAWEMLWVYNEKLLMDPNKLEVGTRLTYISAAGDVASVH